MRRTSRTKAFSSAVASWLVIAAVVPAIARPQETRQVAARRIPDADDRTLSLELKELFRVGSLNGRNDSFGRVMSAALSPSGNLLVADDQAHVVAVFDSTGRFVRNLGRAGSGPGEFRQPWLVAVDPHDSLFVWDASLARVSVFTPDLRFARSLRVPAQWGVVNSMAFSPSGEIHVSAVGGADDTGIQVLARDGSVVRSYHDVPRSVNLLGYESSLLGGSLDIAGNEAVYSRKSPYEVAFYKSGRLASRCRGSDALTTRPEDAIERLGRTSRLNWNKYVHAASVILVDSSLALNVIVDPGRDARTVDLITSDCRLVRRTQMPVPVTIVDRVGARIAAVSNGEFPEVIVYAMTISKTAR